jgi:Caspase domain
VYYSGHGAQANGINYLIPVGSDIQSTGELKARGYDADIIVSEMTEAGSAVNILVLDACRNNPFLSVRSTSGGLATMTASKGTIIAFATSPGAVADDNGRGRNGLYTYFLKSYLTKKGMKIEDVFKKVREEVLKTNPRQIPWESSSLIGDFCIAGCDDAKVVQPVPAPLDRAIDAQAAQTTMPAGSEFALTASDLQRGRCIAGDAGGYRCIDRNRWQTLGRPNLNYSAEARGEAQVTVYCGSLPGDDAQENRCMSREEAVNGLRRCVSGGADGSFLCHSIEYWLKAILDSNLSGSMATQGYTNEPLEHPEWFDCVSEGAGDLRCLRRNPSKS